METILKSVFGKSSEDYFQYITLLLDPEKRVLISAQEEDVLNFLKMSWETSSQLPTEDYFLSKYPGYSVPLKSAKALSLTDLKVHYSNLIYKRTNQNASRALMQVASEVAQTGLTYSHLDTIRAYFHTLDTEEVVDSTDSPDSFREFYKGKKDQPIGLQTFIKEIDSKIGGIAGGMVMVIGGYVGSYKSTLGLNIAYNNAKKLNYNLCYISLEMPKEEIMYNLLCRHSFESKFSEYPYVAHDKIRHCTMSNEEEEFILNTVLPDFYQTGGQLRILDETDFKTLSMSEIREKLEQIDDEMLEQTGYPLDGVFWDHANLLKFNSSKVRRQNENSEANEYISFIRKLSISFRRDKDTGLSRKLSMVVLAQTNRDGWKRAVKNKGRYDLRALAEINELERAAQVICMVYTDDAMKLAKEASIQMLKNRSGVTLPDPTTIFVDPEAYVAGGEMEGFSDMLNMSDLESVFGGSSIVDMF